LSGKSSVPDSLSTDEQINSSASREAGAGRYRLTRFYIMLATVCVLATQAQAVRAVNLGESDPRVLRSIAFKSYLDKNPDDALNYYQRAVASAIKTYGADSTFVADLYYEMGALSLESGKFQTAQGWLQKAVAQNPNSIMARVKLAELLEVRECHNEALAQIQAALKKNPKSLEARHALVNWLIDRKNSASAIKEAYALEQLAKSGASKVSDSSTRVAVVPAPTIPHVEKVEHPQKSSAQTAPAKLPVLGFLRGAPRKPAPPAAETKPEAKAEPKAEPKPVQKPTSKRSAPQAKHVEAPKPAKHAEHTAKHKGKEHPPAHKEAPPAEVTAMKAVPESLNSTLKTTAKQVKTKATAAAKPQPTENETNEPAAEQAPAPVAVAPPSPVHFEQPHKGRPKAGLVPPPPPTVYFPPPQMMQAPRPRPVAKAKPKEPVKEAKEPASEAPEKPVASGSSSDSGDFMLQWADVHKKSKSGK